MNRGSVLESNNPPANALGSDLGTEKMTGVDRLLAGLVLALTIVAYSGTLGFEFVYDDRAQIVDSPFVQSWRFVPRYFTGHVWSYESPQVLGNYYRPLFLLWLRLNHALFELTPWKWHLASLGMHVFVTLLVYWLARRMVRDRLTPCLAALIFGLHPVHVEAVAWVSGVPETMMALLLIGSFLCYLRRGEPHEPGSRHRNRWLAGSLILYALSMLAKETSVVLPMLIFAREWIYSPGKDVTRGTGWRRVYPAIRCAAPYLALTAAYLIARTLALKGLMHTTNPVSLATILLTWPSLLWFYLKLHVWPVGLSAFYDTPYVSHPDLKNFVMPAVAVATAAMGLFAWSRPSRVGIAPQSDGSESRAVALASVWLGLPILPLLNIQVFVPGEIAHDRYLYLPSVGFSILAALALRHLHLGRARVFGQSAIKVGAAIGLASLLALGTVHQSLYWADDLLLYYRGYTVAPNNNLATNNLAIVAAERGLHDVAIKLYKQVISRSPNFWLSNYNLGYTYYKLGMLPEAEQCFRRSIELDARDGDQFLYLGLTRMKMGRLQEAQAAIRHAIKIRPEGRGYHFALGVILKTQGDLPGALNEFKAELVNHPNLAPARAQIAELEARLGGK